MQLAIENNEAFRTWLTSTLAPICDADPAALAKYVMALLKKDRSEQDLKDFCVDQLDVFLQKETKGFVDKLFATIKDGSYLPNQKTINGGAASVEPNSPGTATTSSVPVGISDAPGVSSVRTTSQKHSGVATSSRSRRSTSRGGNGRTKRSSSPNHRVEYRNSRSRSRERHPRPVDRRQQPVRPSREQRGDRDKENRVGQTSVAKLPGVVTTAATSSQPTTSDTHEKRKRRSLSPKGETSDGDIDKPEKRRKKLRCRDFDEKGFCMRGDLCPYDHGPDPVVVDDFALPTMLSMTGASTVKAPVTGPPNFAVPPPGYAAPPVHPPPPGLEAGTYQPEAYNPEAPSINVALTMPSGYTRPPPTAVGARPPPPIWTQQPPPPALFMTRPPVTVSSRTVPLPSMPFSTAGAGGEGDAISNRTVLSTPMPLASTFPMRGGKRPFGQMPGGPGRAPASFDKANCTLEVRRIPSHLNTISKLNEHFSQFGHIVNIQVRYENDPEAALITFASRSQAVGAYKSTAPILNNRFIKIFWHDKEKDVDQASTSTVPIPGKPSVKDRLGASVSGLQQQLDTTSRDVSDDTSMKYRTSGQETDEDGNHRSIMVNNSGTLTRTIYNPDALAAAAAQKPGERKESSLDAQFAQSSQMLTSSLHPKALRKQQKLQDTMKKSLELQKAKSDLLKKELEHQKLLLQQLEKTTVVSQKKEILKTIKGLEQSITVLKEDLLKAAKQTPLISAKSKAVLEKEVLDTELELISQRQAGGDTSDLQKRLTELRLELTALLARSVPISSEQLTTSTPIQSMSNDANRQTPHRKRRAAPQTAVLDKRPRDLVIAGFPAGEKDALIEHLQHFGMLEDIEFTHSKTNQQCRATVVYKTRREAEMALANGAQFRDHQLTIQWVPQRHGSTTDASGSNNEVPSVSEMTAEAILATLDDDDDEDEEEENDVDGSGNAEERADDDDEVISGDAKQTEEGDWKR